MIKYSVEATTVGHPLNFTVEVPETVQECLETYGETLTYNLLLEIILDRAKNSARSLKKTHPTSFVKARMATWRPGVRMKRVDLGGISKEELAKLFPEEQNNG